MNSDLNPLESIQEIRTYIKKSSQFLSMSGWSGIWIGSCGLISGFIAIYLVKTTFIPPSKSSSYNVLLYLALITLFIAVIGGIYFSIRKVIRKGEKLITHVFKRMFINFSIPLFTGGMASIALINYNCTILVPSATLIFYGLSLFTVSRDTLDEVRIVGILEIMLGILSTFFITYSLIFWIIGFGALHIIYGLILWKKYD